MFHLRVGLTLLTVALLGGLLLGQDKKAADPAPPPRASLPQHFKKLGLTDEQTQAVRRIRGEYRAKIDRLRKEIADLQKEERMKYEQVLTPEQRARLRDLRAGGPAKTEVKPPAKDKAPPKQK